MYRGSIDETVIFSKKEEKDITRKGFFIRLYVIVVLMVAMVITLKTTAYAQCGVYEKIYQKDIIGTDLNCVKIKDMVCYTESHMSILKPDVVYTAGIDDYSFHIIVVKTYEGREKLFDLLEKRKAPVVSVEYGHILNLEGDGETVDGSYIGYRLEGVHMAYTPFSKIRTICISPGTDTYVDSISYRKDILVK